MLETLKARLHDRYDEDEKDQHILKALYMAQGKIEHPSDLDCDEIRRELEEEVLHTLELNGTVINN